MGHELDVAETQILVTAKYQARNPSWMDINVREVIAHRTPRWRSGNGLSRGRSRWHKVTGIASSPVRRSQYRR
jgi:hypothetical protein